MTPSIYPSVPCWRVFHAGADPARPMWSALSSVVFTKPYRPLEWAEHDAMFVFTRQDVAFNAMFVFGRGVFELWECEAGVRTSGGRYRQRYMRDQALYPLRDNAVCRLDRLTPDLHDRWLRWTWHATDNGPSFDDTRNGMRATMLCDRLKPLRMVHRVTTER